MQFMITLAPLALGLTAWGLAGAGIFSQKKSLLCGLSWFACACALWFPLNTIRHWVQIGDTSAILDCAAAYALCGGVLLAGTGILNLLAILIKRKG